MVPNAGRHLVGLNLQLATVPRVAHQRQSVGEEASNAVLEREEVHDLGARAALRVKVLVDLEPHHHCEVDVLASDARAHDGNLDALIHLQLQVGHLQLVGNAVELRPTLVVGSNTVVVTADYFFLNDAVSLVELLL